MCQYDARCPVGTHRPGTRCRYSGGSGVRGSWSPPRSRPLSRPSPAPVVRAQEAWVAAGTALEQGVQPGPRYRSSAAAAGVSSGDLLLLLLIAALWDPYYKALGWIGVVVAVFLALAPFVIAFVLTSRCTAWNDVAEGRCRKRRLWAARCELENHSRGAQLITLPEVTALFSATIGVVNLAILIGALQ